MTTQSVPKKLGRSPLLEALFEMRFSAAIAAAGDVLPGLLYGKLKSEYPDVQPLPLASVPRQVRDQNPNLVYQASHRLASANEAVQVGERVVTLSSMVYPGWTVFRDRIETLLAETKETGVIKNVERFSFRYINIVDAIEGQAQLPFINAKIELMGRVPLEAGLHLRAELDDADFKTVVQIVPDTIAEFPAGGQTRGLLIDIDTIKSDPPQDFLVSPRDALSAAHDLLKRVFFSLLSSDTLDRLQPEW